MTLPARMKFGIFMAPFHPLGEDPTLAMDRDLELMQWLDYLGFDEAWIGEHHSAGWETISSPEVFIAAAAERTKNLQLGTGVVSLPYHHPLMVANRMIQLDHMTKGRAMFGVGPGALGSDAYMMGIDPLAQRRRMDESLGVIMRLFTETEPLSYESDWFVLREAMVHLRPYTQPHMPVAVAAAQSPVGMQLAGKYGTGVLSVSVIRDPGTAPNLKKYWQIAEETAAEHGHTVHRENWRLVVAVHLAESRKEAIAQARVKAGRFQREYFEQTIGLPAVFDGPADKIVDAMVDRGAWCVGTPDDLIAHIKRLDEESGGFGGFLLQANEWGTREQVLHSYELLARYVKPHFQGSLANLQHSARWTTGKRDELIAHRTQAIEKAKRDYVEHSSVAGQRS
jgi:limonene 1,2-monooxygenase